jgi:GNAT superfamily N-acetyltransferase
MMAGIQFEFSEVITTKHSTIIKEVYRLPHQKYWVALHGQKVVGTIGIVLYGHSAVIKRMMVDKAFRGSAFNTAKKLMDKAIEWAKEFSAKKIFLGTMQQFKAAQKFYLKNGFVEIAIGKLPSDYPPNPMDTIFYELDL